MLPLIRESVLTGKIISLYNLSFNYIVCDYIE